MKSLKVGPIFDIHGSICLKRQIFWEKSLIWVPFSAKMTLHEYGFQGLIKPNLSAPPQEHLFFISCRTGDLFPFSCQRNWRCQMMYWFHKWSRNLITCIHKAEVRLEFWNLKDQPSIHLYILYNVHVLANSIQKFK